MKQIRLSKGLFALVNDQDFDWLMQWKWYASLESRGTKYYAIRWQVSGPGRRKEKIRMHVEIYKRNSGLSEIPKGFVIDHVNHNSLDNRMVRYDGEDGTFVQYPEIQLEMVTQTENMNRSRGWKIKGRPMPRKENPVLGAV